MLDVQEPDLERKIAPELNWFSAFSDVLASDRKGFDIIVGNPPWGAVKPVFKEYHAHHDESVRNGQGDALRRRVSAAARADVWSDWIDYQDRVRS